MTVRLDLMSRTLHFLVNDEDQGCAVDNLPKGAFRLASCMQFKEQRVVISRFWTSLGRDGTVPNTESTQTQTAEEDKVGKEHEKEEDDDEMMNGNGTDLNAQQRAKELYADYQEPVIDPDAPLFGDDYGVEVQDELRRKEEKEVFELNSLNKRGSLMRAGWDSFRLKTTN